MTENSAENNANAKTSTKPEAPNPTVEEAQFFHPVQLTTGSKENPAVEVEQKLEDLLKSITEETAQLSEFLTEESKLTNELCTSLKQVLKRLNITIDIHPQTIPLDRKVRKAVLNEEGELVVTLEGGEKKKAFLAEYPPDMVMTILWVVMPELVNAMKAYRKKLGTRVGFFVGLKKELKNIARTIVEGEKEENAKPIQEQKPETKTEK
jgi:hypothetical protein